MSDVQQVKSASPAQASGALSDYLRIESCPCCGAPAKSAMPRVASSPPAETLSLERHGKFLSGYTNERVFFTYFECPNCSARFCPTYYRQSQLDGLYGRQAENMVSVPLSARKRTQDDYINLLRRHSRMGRKFPGDRSGYRAVCFSICEGRIVRALLALRTQSRGPSGIGGQFSRVEPYDQRGSFSSLRRARGKCIDGGHDPRARSPA